MRLNIQNLYNLIKKFGLGFTSRSKYMEFPKFLSLGLVDVYSEFLEELKVKIKALIKYIETGGSFKYRICKICQPKKRRHEKEARNKMKNLYISSALNLAWK